MKYINKTRDQPFNKEVLSELRVLFRKTRTLIMRSPHPNQTSQQQGHGTTGSRITAAKQLKSGDVTIYTKNRK
jgi:hypothetical protein